MGGDLAQAVPVLHCAGSGAVVQRERLGIVQPDIGLDRACHELRPGQRRLLAMGWGRRHQQRRHAGDGRNGHAGAAFLVVAGVRPIALGRHQLDSGGDDLGREPSVGGRAPTAEAGEVSGVRNRADRQRVLGGAVVGESELGAVRLGHHVELAVRPYRGV